MIDARVPEKTAMMISGHKTRSTFDRYDIATEESLGKALEEVSDHLADQPQTGANVFPIRNVQEQPKIDAIAATRPKRA